MKNKNQMEGSLLTRKDIDKAAWSYIFFAQATGKVQRNIRKLWSATCSFTTQSRSWAR